MEITIKVSDYDAKRIQAIGEKPWKTVTDEEKKEFDGLISLYGTAVCKAVTE
jgi:hypothetical protein